MDFKQNRSNKSKGNGGSSNINNNDQRDKNGSISEIRGRTGTGSENYEKFDEILK